MCSAFNLTYLITCVGVDGRHTVHIFWEHPSIAVDEALKNQYMKELYAHPRRSESGGKATQLYPIFARVLPAIAMIRRSAEDELWVEAYTMESGLLETRPSMSPATPSDWTVFAADGRMLAAVQLPARFVPFEIGRDYVLGVTRDDDDAELVTLYYLRRD